MRKYNFALLMVLCSSLCLFTCEGAAANSVDSGSSWQMPTTKPAVMRRDQVDPTSTLAIPLDDSEIEDEEELARWEKEGKSPAAVQPAK